MKYVLRDIHDPLYPLAITLTLEEAIAYAKREVEGWGRRHWDELRITRTTDGVVWSWEIKYGKPHLTETRG